MKVFQTRNLTNCVPKHCNLLEAVAIILKSYFSGTRLLHGNSCWRYGTICAFSCLCLFYGKTVTVERKFLLSSAQDTSQ